MADPERGLWERSNFKEVPQFLKSYRISFAYGLTSNKDQTCMNKSYFVFILYRGMCQFSAISGGSEGGGAWPRLTPLDPALKVMAPRPRLLGICVIICVICVRLLNVIDDICTDYFPKVHANYPLHRRILSSIQTKHSEVGVEAV